MSTGNQFALIPWRAQIRSGGLRAWPDAAVSILPVLAVHESPLLEAWPSQTRIASLAGVSKTTLGAGLRFLVEQGWISLTKSFMSVITVFLLLTELFHIFYKSIISMRDTKSFGL